MDRFKLLIAVIGILTLLGMLAIILLLVLWRQQLKRLARQGETRSKDITPPQQDLWYESGQRLARQVARDADSLPSQDDDPPTPDDDSPPQDQGPSTDPFRQ